MCFIAPSILLPICKIEMDYIDFLYLNPQISVQNNLKTYEDVHNFWINNSNTYSNVPINTNYVPINFKHKLYAIDNKSNIDFSDINYWIKQSLLLDNSDPNCINNAAEYFPNIYKYVTSIGTDSSSNSNTVFEYNDSNYYPSLTSNDSIKLINTTNNHEFIGNVISTSSNSFISDIKVDSNTQLLLYGIKVYDLERLAKIDYYNYQLSNNPYFPDDFNFKLYNLLYKHNFQDLESAYIHATLHPENNIVNVGDINIGSGGGGNSAECNVINNIYKYAPSNQYNDIIIDGNIRFKNNELSYVTNDQSRPLETISSTNKGLITEYAIKQYISDTLIPNLTLSNVVADTITTSNINIDKFESTITFESNVSVTCNLEVGGTVHSSVNKSGKYGIGTTNLVPNYNSSLSNFNAKNLNLTGNLYTSSTTQVDGYILGSKDISSKGAFYGMKLGIGSVQFATSNTVEDNVKQATLFDSNINIIDTQYTKTNFLIEDFVPYDNGIIENLEFISGITKQAVDTNSIKSNYPTQDIVINRNIVVNNNKIKLTDAEILFVNVNDYIIDNTGNTYRIIAVDNSISEVTLAEPAAPSDNTIIQVSKILIVNKDYMRQQAIVKEMLKQMVELAKMVEHTHIHISC